jgi:hypothetical protein
VCEKDVELQNAEHGGLCGNSFFFFFFFFFFFLFFFFFHWHYSPLWALACRTRSFHFFLSPTLSIVVKSIQLFPLFDFRNNKFFTVWGC